MEGRTYRYFRGKPLYPFGHGLSYTRVQLFGSDGRKRAHDAPHAARVHVTVENTGERAGDEVVQIYLSDLEATVPRSDSPVGRLRTRPSGTRSRRTPDLRYST